MEKVENKIGQDFTVLSLAKFALPAFLMNIFTQIFHSLDDGLFISRYAGQTALASMNLLNPMAGILLAIEHLFSLGAANISAKLMGEGKQQEAKRVFSRVVVSGLVLTILFSLVTNIFAEEILYFLGADEEMLSYGIYQIRIVYLIAPISLVDQIFTCYYSTAGKPKMGTICAIINGAVNIGLDIILVAICDLGVVGACIATACGDIATFIVGMIFFSNKKQEIHFVNPEGNYLQTTYQSACYAIPQSINSISFSITALVSNKIILQYVGSSGVAVNAIVCDIRKIMTSGLIGFAVCVGPVISYNYGSKNIKQLKKMLTHILKIWAISSVLLTTIGLFLNYPLVTIFTSESTSQDFLDMAHLALAIEMFATPFVSGNVITSRMLISLTDKKDAIKLSVFRNLIIKTIIFVLLPMLIGEIGIWLSVPLSEFLACCYAAILLYKNRNNYGYGKTGQALKI